MTGSRIDEQRVKPLGRGRENHDQSATGINLLIAVVIPAGIQVGTGKGTSIVPYTRQMLFERCAKSATANSVDLDVV